MHMNAMLNNLLCFNFRNCNANVNMLECDVLLQANQSVLHVIFNCHSQCDFDNK